jgi:membrane protease YdiL (CAAX protease family)
MKKSIQLNTKTAALVVGLYLVGSIVITLIVSIFMGGAGGSENATNIENYIGHSLVANLIISFILFLVAVVQFKDSRKDIFFERTAFHLSRLYWAIPLVEVGIAIITLFNVQYSLMAFGSIFLVLVASLSIGFNEEVVTRGILLVGLRNDKVSEWKVYVITLLVFSLLHLVNLVAGGSFLVILIQFFGGTIYYVARRVSNSLIVPILIHALYDFSVFLLNGPYPADTILADQPGFVGDITFIAFLVEMSAFILFIIFGRKLLKNETTGWAQT